MPAKSPFPKVTLDAVLDQSFAATREHRGEAHPYKLMLASQAAGLLLETFAGPGQAEAARVVMACAQILETAAHQLDGEVHQHIHGLSDIFALAADQMLPALPEMPDLSEEAGPC